MPDLEVHRCKGRVDIPPVSGRPASRDEQAAAINKELKNKLDLATE